MLDDIATQAGMLTRTQALAHGLTSDRIRAHLDAGRWQRMHRSVYATFSGPVPRAGHLWAVALQAGPRAVLSHETAAEMVGLAAADTGTPIHVTVPSDRRVMAIAGAVIHYSRRVDTARHPSRLPPQTRVEETVVDLSQSADSLEQAMAWIARGCGRRLTRPDRIAAVVSQHKKLRWRAELLAALDGATCGATTPLPSTATGCCATAGPTS